MEKIDKQLRDKLNKPVSVLEAKRIHSGTITVIGTIVSITEMYVIEKTPPNVGYRDAKSIQLEDTEKLDENERLDVILYDDMISDVRAGELVEISGTINIEDKKESKKSKKKIVVLHAGSIKYLNRKEGAETMYNTSLPNTYRLLNAGSRIHKQESLMFLLLGPQNYQICPPGIKRIGWIAITVVPNNELRALHVYLKL